ncbi:MAG: P-II family nitrogen regulator, partial [Lachnospiraceae bacterium]|nr:P-II family nitrogen regulator [Lachnospiraceae bacterium]
MGKLCMMTTIVNRKHFKKYFRLYQDEHLPVMFVTLGAGTASGDILDYLGLESTEKAVMFHVLEESAWENTKKDLRHKLQIDAPGEGIAFVVPLSSIGGRKALQFLSGNQDFQKEEESVLKDTVYELIVV